jgi:hypothetical protein
MSSAAQAVQRAIYTGLRRKWGRWVTVARWSLYKRALPSNWPYATVIESGFSKDAKVIPLSVQAHQLIWLVTRAVHVHVIGFRIVSSLRRRFRVSRTSAAKDKDFDAADVLQNIF